MSGTEFERCYECEKPTGRSGKGEDSLYVGELGPYCDDCYNECEKLLFKETENENAN